MPCTYCGSRSWDPDFEAEEDGWATCHSGGCGITMPSADVNDEDLRFGMHIVIPDAVTDEPWDEADEWLESEAERQANRLAGRDI